MPTGPREKLLRLVAIRTRDYTPSMNRAVLDVFRKLADEMTDAELRAALRTPDRFVERVLNQARMDRTMFGLRIEVAKQARVHTEFFTAHIPGLPTGTAVAAGFDVLDPAIIEAVRKLDSKVVTNLSAAIRESVRAEVTRGLEAGWAHAKIGRNVRATIGLAPNQAEAVWNFRQELESGRFGAALRRRLRDRRFDASLRRGMLSADQIDKMVAAYRRRWIAFNAQVNAGTAARDAVRLGKHLATESAIANGYLDRSKMFSEWVDSDDNRVRPLHELADGEIVRFGDPFPTTNEVIPGESTYNCRCIKRDFYVGSGSLTAARLLRTHR